MIRLGICSRRMRNSVRCSRRLNKNVGGLYEGPLVPPAEAGFNGSVADKVMHLALNQDNVGSFPTALTETLINGHRWVRFPRRS